jgi:hypothetical protein
MIFALLRPIAAFPSTASTRRPTPFASMASSASPSAPPVSSSQSGSTLVASRLAQVETARVQYEEAQDAGLSTALMSNKVVEAALVPQEEVVDVKGKGKAKGKKAAGKKGGKEDA